MKRPLMKRPRSSPEPQPIAFRHVRRVAWPSCGILFWGWLLGASSLPAQQRSADADRLPGTELLREVTEVRGGWIQFLHREIEASVARRQQYWRRDYRSAKSYVASVAPNRQRFCRIIGLQDPRVPFDAPELVATLNRPALVGRGAGYDIFAVRWPVVGDIHGEGLLLSPRAGDAVADVVALPDADHSPEQLVGLEPGMPPAAQYARRLAESGCRVLVPMLINRKSEVRFREERADAQHDYSRQSITSREFVYRPAFMFGRHIIGYEVQKVLAAVDWMTRDSGRAQRRVGVIGWGEGGLIALYSAAVDTRIDAACVSGYFQPREGLWSEPYERNVFGLLSEFGDAEIASLVAPRDLILEHCPGLRGYSAPTVEAV